MLPDLGTFTIAVVIIALASAKRFTPSPVLTALYLLATRRCMLCLPVLIMLSLHLLASSPQGWTTNKRNNNRMPV